MYVPIVVEYSTHAVWEKGLALLTELQRICTSTATNVIFLAVTIKKLRLQRDECNRKEKNQSGLIYKAINKPHLAWLVIFLGGGGSPPKQIPGTSLLHRAGFKITITKHF